MFQIHLSRILLIVLALESAYFSSQNVVQSTKNRRKGALEMWRWHNLWCATVL